MQLRAVTSAMLSGEAVSSCRSAPWILRDADGVVRSLGLSGPRFVNRGSEVLRSGP